MPHNADAKRRLIRLSNAYPSTRKRVRPCVFAASLPSFSRVLTSVSFSQPCRTCVLPFPNSQVLLSYDASAAVCTAATRDVSIPHHHAPKTGGRQNPARSLAHGVGCPATSVPRLSLQCWTRAVGFERVDRVDEQRLQRNAGWYLHPVQ